MGIYEKGNTLETSIGQILTRLVVEGAAYEEDLCAAGVVRGEFGKTEWAVRRQVIPAMIERGLLKKSFDSLNIPVFSAA